MFDALGNLVAYQWLGLQDTPLGAARHILVMDVAKKKVVQTTVI
jgi:hypothetical protein